MDARFIIACLLLVGCSASERIAVETNSIGERAAEIHRLALRIGETSDQPEVVTDAASIAVEATAIGKGTQAIHASLPGVTDRTPWWADLLRWIAIAAAGAAAVWLVSATGIGSAVRIAIGWLPRRKLDDAAMCRAALDQNDPVSIREYIAMRRSQDKEWDLAWRSTNNKEEPHV